MLRATATLLILISMSAAASEWRLGLAYASGLGEVTDLYEDNLGRAGYQADVSVKFPLGLAAGYLHDLPGGARLDLGVGPVFLIGGDVKHLEVPVSATAGYAFTLFPHATPYLRGGVIYHVTDGDLYSRATPGVFAAAGVDFTHFAFEVAADRSQVEFDALTCGGVTGCRLTTSELHTYEILASFYWRFRLHR